MTIVNVLEAKTNLSRLIAEVEAGGEVIIARNNKPVVRLVPADQPAGVAEPAAAWQGPAAAVRPRRVPGRLAGSASGLPPGVPGRQPKRVPGTMKGLMEWDDRFNDPLPDDELRLWNGEGD